MKYTEQFNSGPEYLTDKCWPHSYGPKVYDELFEPIQNSVRNYLEIGSAYGGSCLLSRDYFPRATIWTIDRLVPNRRIRDSERIVSLCADAYQQKVANMFEPEMDIIIDDGSHNIDDQCKAIDLYLEKLLPGGLFIIEDVEWPENSFKLFDERVELIKEDLVRNGNNWITYDIATYIGPEYFNNVKPGREKYAEEEMKKHGELKMKAKDDNLYIVKRVS